MNYNSSKNNYIKNLNVKIIIVMYSKGGENGIFWGFLGFFKKVGGGGRRLKKNINFIKRSIVGPKSR